MSKKKLITRSATMTVDGTVDLNAALTTNLDTIVKAINNDVAVTLASVADSQYDHGSLDESAYPAIVFHYKSGVTTVLDFENLVTTSIHLAVVTPGTPGTLLLVTADDFPASTLATGTISAANDACVVDVSDMTNVTVSLNQLTDAGTVVIAVEKSADGTNFAVLDASSIESDFPVGANKAIHFSLSDANGMSLPVKQVKATCSALAGGGVYSMTVTGLIES